MRQKEVFVSLKKKKEISLIFKSAEKRSTENLLFRYRITFSEPGLNILIATGREAKNAVERNRMKRVLKAALFLALKSWGKPKNAIMGAIHVRKSFLDLPLEKRIREIQKLFKPFYEKTDKNF